MDKKVHREFTGRIKPVAIPQVPRGKYFVSVLVETEHVEMPRRNKNMGLDFGIKDLCITSDRVKYENPKIIRKYEKKLVELQRQLENKEKWGNNYYKQKKKIALCHEKIRNTRKDYLHRVSHEIISKNQVVISEILQIKNMEKNHHLVKSISHVSWYELTRWLDIRRCGMGGSTKNRYILCKQPDMLWLWISKCGYERFISKGMDLPNLWNKT